jgi:hypothetical protein
MPEAFFSVNPATRVYSKDHMFMPSHPEFNDFRFPEVRKEWQRKDAMKIYMVI